MKKQSKVKQELLEVDINKEEPKELLYYKIKVLKRDNRKNILIAVLITSMIAFAIGLVVR